MSRYRTANEMRPIPIRLSEEEIATLDRWAEEGGWANRGAMLASMIREIIQDTEKTDAAGTR